MKGLKHNMKKLNKIIVLATIGLAVAVTACGNKEQDPTKNSKYESLRAGVPLGRQEVPNQSTMSTLFYIDADADRNFIQNAEKTINFKVRLNFADPSEIRYSLALKSDELKKLGAKFAQSGPDTWSLTWRPSSQILTSIDNGNMPFDIEIQFLMSNNNSRLVLNQFAGHEDTQHFQIFLLKDQTQPIVKDEVKMAPASTLNPDQTAKIQFTVAAKGFDKKESVDAILVPGPEAPSLELTQVDALVGKNSALKLIKSSEIDKEGYTLFVFEFNFDARTYADYVMTKINQSEHLKNKFSKGQITSAEAVFAVEGINRYNGQKSAQKIIRFEVNLSDKPGRPVLVGQDNLSVKIGADSNQQFYIRASDGRSQLKVESITVLGQPLNIKDARASFVNDEVTISLTCGAGTAGLNEHFGCKTGVCYQNCIIHAQTTCQAKSRKIPVVISASSALRTAEEKSNLNLTVNVSEKSSLCLSAEAKAAAPALVTQDKSGGQKP